LVDCSRLLEPLDIAQKLYPVFFENPADVVVDRFTIDPELLEARCKNFQMVVVCPDAVPQVRFQFEPGQIILDLLQGAGCDVVKSCHAQVL
jgi:hypothetical protein